MGLITKVFTWVKVNLASVLGITQAVIKALKEVLTAVINLISIFFPVVATEKFVTVIRDILNWFDEIIEWLKIKLIPVVD